MHSDAREFAEYLAARLPAAIARKRADFFLGGVVASGTLEVADCEGRGPKAYRAGATVIYRTEDLLRWLGEAFGVTRRVRAGAARQEVSAANAELVEKFVAELLPRLPLVIARQFVVYYLGGMVAYNTLCNDDARGLGPAMAWDVGDKVVYSTEALLRYVGAKLIGSKRVMPPRRLREAARGVPTRERGYQRPPAPGSGPGGNTSRSAE